MRLKPSHLFVGGTIAVVLAYFGLRSLIGPHAAAAAPAPAHAAAPLLVTAILSAPVDHPFEVVARGRTEAPRTVQVKAATAGVVSATPVLQGAYVKAGQLLCRQQVDARQAMLDQAHAKLKSAELQYQANQQLQAKGFRSETQVLAARADLDQAAATTRSAEVALEQMNIRAPFAGVFDHRDAEIGAYLAPGMACGTVIELDPLLVVGDVSEADAMRLRTGAEATARLGDGQTLRGRVRYVAHDSDAATRTYRVEVVVPNRGASIRAGQSAEIHVAAGRGPAYLIPITALVLDSAGRQGVRWVRAGGQVAFTPVKTLDETPQGVWVAGLQGPVRVITVGQAYVAEGQRVRVAGA